jgi:hypothetical protein
MSSGCRHLFAAGLLLASGLLVASLTGVAAALPTVTAQVSDPVAFMRTALQLTPKEATSIAQGRAVAKTLAAETKRDVTTAGAVHINSPSFRFVEQFRTLEGFRTSQFVLQIARFNDPPQLSDLDALTIEEADIDAFRGCQVGACEVRLAADDIRRFKEEVDWAAPDAAQKASALYKNVLLAHLTSYRARGLDAIAQYDDQVPPTRLADETRELLKQSPSPLDAAPALREHLLQFPANNLARTEHFFYWSKEAFGFKPVVGLNHVSLHTTDGGHIFIVTTQIYASHYMDGQSAVSALFAAPADTPAFHWLYFNRARIGRLDGLLGALSRPIVQRRARNGLGRTLTQTKQRMEAAAR